MKSYREPFVDPAMRIRDRIAYHRAFTRSPSTMINNIMARYWTGKSLARLGNAKSGGGEHHESDTGYRK